ncbi:MAG: helix-turn-helix domain-containing protein [Deltaproteobacteria bacterium]|nr:helix-turn-helix domain-containing protein [Deltaproteobacteria bacterium]
MNEKLKGGMFATAQSSWELKGWLLRRYRLQIGETQTTFALIAGWSQQYQAQIESSPVPVLGTQALMDTIAGTFARIKRQDSKYWYTCMKSFKEPEDVAASMFVQHKRYELSGVKLSNVIDSRAARRNFVLLSGWSIDYVRKLCRGDIQVVNELAALKIVQVLVSLQDPGQVEE